MRLIFLILVNLAFLPSACAAGLADVFRSVSSAIGRESPAPATTPTATIGVRGHDEDGNVKATGHASEEAKLLEGWAVTRKEAESVASKKGLVSRNVEYEGAAQATSSGSSAAPAPGGM